MLLNFVFCNFRSFREETVFTMIPSPKKMHSEYLIRRQGKQNIVKSLPVSVIYGANASGKSNVILAMYVLKKIVTLGTLDTKELEPFLNVLPFIHDKNFYEPTLLEITFFQNENIYKYGISLQSKFGNHDIVKEYLFINGDNIFMRDIEHGIEMPIRNLIKNGHIQQNNIGEEFYYTLLTKLNETLDSQQLFLFSGIKNLINNDYFVDIQKWFERFMVVMNASDVSFNQRDLKIIKSMNANGKEISNRQFYESETIKEILNYAEFGNQQIQFLSDMDKDNLSMVSLYKMPESDKKMEIKMIVSSELTESKGTIQLIRLIQPFVDALRSGGIIVMDEMDASLHFEIIVSLIRIFNNKQINTSGAQLIFNTHNPIYLDGTLLRHDQILMANKNRDTLVSELYALADYGLRPEERILKNYLDGKYGALPHMDLEIAFKHILEGGE